ncbi:MAG: ATP-binding protein [Acidobacteriota bacterium]
MISRPGALRRIRSVFRVHPVAALLGPRQCGKTTLARRFAEGSERSTFFDLENPVDRQRLSNPMRVLGGLEGLVVIDEVQQQPELFEVLRVLVDRPGQSTRFLVLGSASPRLVAGVAETLAGRVDTVDLSGFSLAEVGEESRDRLWVRGGFPRSFLADDEEASFAWRDAFVRTFLERDLPQLGITIPAEALRRFWTMIAHSHAQVWNASGIGRSLGASDHTVRRYLDVLAGAFMLRVLPPWYENLKKRQVKAPKVYLRDSGLLHTLLRLRTQHELLGHPKLGASWEGLALEQILVALNTRDAYFWATHAGAELDLLVMDRGRRFGFELKYAEAPSVSRSMRSAVRDLGLDRLWIVVPDGPGWEIDERIAVTPLAGVAQAFEAAASPSG